ncbi:Endonuclease/exonuclease/phosphatase, partial [Coprinopsis marcescibilis]
MNTDPKPKPRTKFKTQRTPEQIAVLKEQRKLKTAAVVPEIEQQNSKPVESQLLKRPWLTIDSPPVTEHTLDIKVLTWNLLAQCLVRRELFPTSNCLKATQREPLIHQEIQRLDADILCLQEVDRMDRLGRMLEKAGYTYRFAAGPKKLHGCLVAFKTSQFSFQEEKVVHYDAEEVRTDGDDRQKLGRSFQTRNIGFVVALSSVKNPSEGIVVGTTHLFWHPRYTYERARQAGILAREATRFKKACPDRQTWPCILAGDFNFPPDDPGYALLTGSPLLREQIQQRLHPSYVVHATVDPSVTKQSTDTEEGGDGEDADPDKVITNARHAQPNDGLLSTEELVSLFAQSPQANSSYHVGLKQYSSSNSIESFGSRSQTSVDRPGYFEPIYTSYTHYWKSVLDYIFVLADVDQFEIVGLLAPLGEKDLEPGLPQKGVCGSDHLPLVAQIQFRGQ